MRGCAQSVPRNYLSRAQDVQLLSERCPRSLRLFPPYDPRETFHDHQKARLMPTLDTRGKIAGAEIGFYVPIAVITLLLIFRYVLRRDAGWLFLFAFSGSEYSVLQSFYILRIFILVRIAGGALVVAGQLAKTPNPMLLNAAYIMDYVGISAILLSTLGFIGMAYVTHSIHVTRDILTISSGQHTYSENRRLIISLRFTGFFILAGVGVGAAGGAIGVSANANASLATALHRAGVCIFVAAYIFIAGLHIAAWTYRWHLRSYRRSVSSPLQCARVHQANLRAFPAINWYQLCLSVSWGTSGLCRACSLVSFGSSWTPPLLKCHHRKIQPCDRELDPILGAGSCDGMGGSRALPVRQHGAGTEKTSLVTNRHLALRKCRYI